MKSKLICGDCLELSKELQDNSVDLVVTSPPYADVMFYGNNVKNYTSDEYSNKFLSLFKEADRFLKVTGSFILNINDKVSNGERQLYVYELVLKICNETNLKLFDRYIWHKKTTLPVQGQRRLNDRIEYIFHFVKDPKKFKSNMDSVRVPYKEVSLKRFRSKMHGNSIVDACGRTVLSNRGKSKPHPKGAKPTTVFRFNTCSALRGEIKHPASFHYELPEFFINWLTDKGDVVLDPFMGSGTTAVTCNKLKRRWIGFDINPVYIEMTKKRIKIEQDEEVYGSWGWKM